MPMTEVRTWPMTMTGAAAGAEATRSGKPNSSMAPRAVNRGHMPPNVMVEATLFFGVCLFLFSFGSSVIKENGELIKHGGWTNMSAGMWRSASWSNIVGK